jgi:CspA family cold shock protein
MDPVGQGAERIDGAEGVVKWFDPRKGFGFIVGPAGQDIFVHYSVIDGDGFRVLRDGSSVHYDAHNTDKGWKATRVQAIGEVHVTDRVRREEHRTPRK